MSNYSQSYLMELLSMLDDYSNQYIGGSISEADMSLEELLISRCRTFLSQQAAQIDKLDSVSQNPQSQMVENVPPEYIAEFRNWFHPVPPVEPLPRDQFSKDDQIAAWNSRQPEAGDHIERLERALREIENIGGLSFGSPMGLRLAAVALKGQEE